MPTVPDASTPQQQEEPLPGRAIPRYPEEASPAQMGAGVGAGLEQAANIRYGMEQKATLEADRTAATNAQTQLDQATESLMRDPKSGALTRQGGAAVNLAPTYMPQFDAAAAKIQGALSNPRQQQAFAQITAERRHQTQQQLDAHEFEQSQVYQENVDKSALQSAQDRASLNSNSEPILAQSKSDIAAVVTNNMERKGYDPASKDGKAAIDEAIGQQYSAMHVAVLERQLGDERVGDAKAYLTANKAELKPNEYEAFSSRIEAKEKEAQNEMKQDISDRYGDSLKALEFGLPGSIAVSRKELDIAFPHDAQRRWDELMIMQGAGAAAKKYDQMTASDITADVNAREPKTGGPEAIYKIEAYQIAQRAAQRSLSARASDPAQFAIDTNRWSPLDLRQPTQVLSQLSSRANTQDSLSGQIGVATPLLSKDEAKQFTGFLDRQEPAARLQTLTGLRSSLSSDEAYTSLLRQVAPNSPLTAIAGATLDKPADAPVWYTPPSNGGVTGQRILEGESILRDKGEKGIKSTFPMPPDKDLQNAFQSAMGGASSDLFRGRPDTQQTYWAAYKAYYAAEASKQGKANGVINSDVALRAAQDVLGHVTQYGFSQVAVPSGMDPTKFEGLADRARDASLRAAGYSDTDAAALRGAGLRELGDTLGTGKYVVINGNGDPLKSKDGSKSVIIDLNQQYSANLRTGQISRPAPGQLDTSKYALPPNDPSANQENWDKRADGSTKGNGFLGLLKRPDGRVSSEISIGVEINGKETEIPTMVPTLSQAELDHLMTTPVGKGVPKSIRDKAVAFAKQRVAAGKSPFAGPEDSPHFN